MENIRFYNNTFVQHIGSWNEGVLWIVIDFFAGGVGDFELKSGTVFLTNELYLLDGGIEVIGPFHQNFEMDNMLLLDTAEPDYEDVGVADVSGISPTDFDLVLPDGPAVDQGTDIEGSTLDFLNRARKFGSATDIGAFEHGAPQEECRPAPAPAQP